MYVTNPKSRELLRLVLSDSNLRNYVEANVGFRLEPWTPEDLENALGQIGELTDYLEEFCYEDPDASDAE